MSYVVGRTTVSNGRTWWVSKIRGVGWSGDPAKARVFPELPDAERWAAMEQRDIDRGIGGQHVFVARYREARQQ